VTDRLTLRVLLKNQGSYAPGVAVDHIVASLSGPTNPPSQTLGANVQYVTFGPGLALGTYTYTFGAYDATNTLLAPAITGTTTLAGPVINAALPQRLVIYASPTAGYVRGRVLYNNGGSFTSTQVPSTLVCTITGTVSLSVTVGASSQTFGIGPGMVFGQYNYSLQLYDQNGGAMGPPANGSFWYNPTPNSSLPVPQSALPVNMTNPQP
jgi:hypothetical protein